jgi:hypothetical protein
MSKVLKVFTKPITWLFSKTEAGKFINGHKTVIGFIMIALGYVVQLLADATGMFPDVQAIHNAHTVLVGIEAAVRDMLVTWGGGIMTVGLGHKAIKEAGE